MWIILSVFLDIALVAFVSSALCLLVNELRDNKWKPRLLLCLWLHSSKQETLKTEVTLGRLSKVRSRATWHKKGVLIQMFSLACYWNSAPDQLQHLGMDQNSRGNQKHLDVWAVSQVLSPEGHRWAHIYQLACTQTSTHLPQPRTEEEAPCKPVQLHYGGLWWWTLPRGAYCWLLLGCWGQNLGNTTKRVRAVHFSVPANFWVLSLLITTVWLIKAAIWYQVPGEVIIPLLYPTPLQMLEQ